MKINKSQKIFYTCLSFIIGILLGNFMHSTASLYICAISLIIFLIIYLYKKKFIILCLLITSIAILYFQYYEPPDDSSHIKFYNGQNTTFTGTLLEPDERVDHTKLTIKSKTPAKGHVLIKTTLYPKYHYGDKLEITCKLQSPEPIENFRYDNYLARHKIYSVCYSPRIKLISKNKGNKIIAILLNFKSTIQTTINNTLPEPHASFMSGILIGARKGIPEDLMQAFNRTGVTHIIAISGYNITIISIMIMNFCLSMGINRKKAFKFIIVGITFFVIITGATAAVVRSAIMGIIVLLAKQLGRKSNTENILALTATLMLIVNPKILLYDAGFQLSFLATMGLIYLSPKVEPLFKWVTNKFAIRENLTSTISAITITTPLILYQFERFSIVAPIVNLLILSFIPLSMLTGFIQVITGLIYIPLGKIIGYTSYFILEYIIRIIQFFAKFNFASIEMSVSFPIMIIMYIGLFFFCIKKDSHIV